MFFSACYLRHSFVSDFLNKKLKCTLRPIAIHLWRLVSTLRVGIVGSKISFNDTQYQCRSEAVRNWVQLNVPSPVSFFPSVNPPLPQTKATLVYKDVSLIKQAVCQTDLIQKTSGSDQGWAFNKTGGQSILSCRWLAGPNGCKYGLCVHSHRPD